MVTPLRQVPHYIPRLAEAHAREWAHLYTAWNRETARAEFHSEGKTAALPTTLVLHQPDGQLIGSVSLILNDLPSRPDLNPWLASLYVFPDFRRQGHGRRLVQAALSKSHELGHTALFLFTENRVSFFSQFGFEVVCQETAAAHAITIMRADGRAPARPISNLKFQI
jgi:N-acetylglutamate synthase-like GNAT family acetyltransferase